MSKFNSRRARQAAHRARVKAQKSAPKPAPQKRSPLWLLSDLGTAGEGLSFLFVAVIAIAHIFGSKS